MFVGGGQTSKHRARAKRNAIDRGNEAKIKINFSRRSARRFRHAVVVVCQFRMQYPGVPQSPRGKVPQSSRCASPTSPSRDVIEPTKDYWLDMAALATELEKMLIKHADGHHNSPDFAATGTT